MYESKLLNFEMFLTLLILVSSMKHVHGRIHLKDLDLAEPVQNLTHNKDSSNFYFKPNELNDADDYSDDELYDDDDVFKNKDNLDQGSTVSLEIKRNEFEKEIQTDNNQEDPLIKAFKIKLLQLLGLDAVPTASFLENEQIPEAVYKQHKLNKDQIHVQSRVKNAKVLKHRFRVTNSRRLRSKPNEPEDEDYIRFNSSITKEITLISKALSEDTKTDWCSEKSHNAQNELLTPLSCFNFKLDNHAFKTNQLHSAKLYFKLDAEEISKIITEPIFIVQIESLVNRTANLYIEANGFLIKRIDLTKINYLNEDFTFNKIQIKSILGEILDSDQSEGLRIRILAGIDLIQLSDSVWALKRMFSKMDENMALNVKFGDLIVMNKNDRKRRDVGNVNTARRQYKTTKDCNDLRQMGYSPSNYTCCRETISVTVEQLGWNNFILSPDVIEYKYCRGACLTDVAPKYDNTNILYKMFEMSNTFEASHCCNIYDYEKPIALSYTDGKNYLTKTITLNAKTCSCS